MEDVNIYLISQMKVQGYDIYDSAVVVAESEADARSIHPSGTDAPVVLSRSVETWDTWCSQRDVEVKEIGVIFEGMDRGVICASFNAA